LGVPQCRDIDGFITQSRLQFKKGAPTEVDAKDSCGFCHINGAPTEAERLIQINAVASASC
jgi:hypothetical protein